MDFCTDKNLSIALILKKLSKASSEVVRSRGFALHTVCADGAYLDLRPVAVFLCLSVVHTQHIK